MRACTYQGKSYLEIEIKTSNCSILNNFLEQLNFLEFNKFLLFKFLEKIQFLALDPFTEIYLNLCLLNKDLNKVFPVKDVLIVSNHNKNLEIVCSGSKTFYTFPASLISNLSKTGSNSFDNFLKFSVFYLYEKCTEMQLFSLPFSQFAASQHKRNSLATITNNFIGQIKTNFLVLTVLYNDFLADMGFHISTRNRKMLNKALDVIYDTSFTRKSTNSSIQIKERLVYSMGKHKKNNQQLNHLMINPHSFLLYFSS